MISKRKLPAMHEAYGVSSTPHKCRECSNFRAYTFKGQKYLKCAAYGDTAGGETDWGANFLACGMFNVPMGDMLPLIERIWRQKSEGQCAMDV